MLLIHYVIIGVPCLQNSENNTRIFKMIVIAPVAYYSVQGASITAHHCPAKQQVRRSSLPMKIYLHAYQNLF